jgi:hypothetical protein
MEQVIDWLNENELRAYPLMDASDKIVTSNETSWLLPDNFLLDLQLTVTTHNLSNPDTTVIPVALTKLKYTHPDSLEVTFGISGAAVSVFTLADCSNLTFPVYVRNPDGSLAVFGEGVLTVVDSYNQTTTESVLDIAVEPSTYVQFNDAWLGVRSLQVSPEKISKSVYVVGIADSYEPQLPLVNVLAPQVLVGDVKFLGGYNFRVDVSSGAIDLEINANRGLKMNCSTSFIHEDYLDCHELVSYINGVPPDENGAFKINPGTNVDIVSGNILTAFNDPLTETANSHTLFVGLTFQATDLCAPVIITPGI